MLRTGVDNKKPPEAGRFFIAHRADPITPMDVKPPESGEARNAPDMYHATR